MGISINDPITDFGPAPKLEVKRKNVVWAILPLIVLVLGLGVSLRQVGQQQRLLTQASGGVVLSFLVNQTEVKAGDMVDIDVFLDTHNQVVSDASIYLIFPHESLEPIGISNSALLPELLEEGKVGPGAAYIKVGSSNMVKGVGSIAKLRFKTLESGKFPIQFSEETVVTNRTSTEEKLNLIDKVINLNLVVK